MQIRRAQPDEAPLLTAIACQSKAHWSYSPAQLDAWRDALSIDAASIEAWPTFVVELGDRVAGFYAIDNGPPVWVLEHFWVVPECMGRGLGRALLAHAAALAKRSGVHAIAIDADPNAEAFYLACGAQRVGAVAAPIEGQPQRQRPQLALATAAERVDDDFGYAWRARKRGEVQVLHRGRLAATLRGADAAEFLSEMAGCTPGEAQHVMARLTGNYKHGNERAAANHPRNRR